MQLASVGANDIIQIKMSGLWTIFTLDSSVLTCAADMAGVIMGFAGKGMKTVN